MKNDYGAIRELDEWIAIDETWHKEHINELTTMTFDEAILKYPVEACKIRMQHLLGLYPLTGKDKQEIIRPSLDKR